MAGPAFCYVKANGNERIFVNNNYRRCKDADPMMFVSAQQSEPTIPADGNGIPDAALFFDNGFEGVDEGQASIQCAKWMNDHVPGTSWVVEQLSQS